MTQLGENPGPRWTWQRVLPGIAILLCIFGILACGCTKAEPATTTPTPTATAAPPVATTVALTNPAADHCHNMKGTYQIRTNPDGSQFGVCMLPGGQVCDAVKYMTQCVCTAPVTPTA